MRSRVQKWGNSLGLRIPKVFATDTELVAGSEVEIEVDDGRLVITKVAKPSYRLEDLLTGITPENLHETVDWGEPVGVEAW